MINKKNKELILRITKDDLDIESMRGSGPGGQKKNKTDSCIRMSHKPSGTVVRCEEHRSQHANKIEAFKKLVKKDSFLKWVKVETARRTGTLDRINYEVRQMMNEPNMKTEVQVDGRWKEVELKDLEYG